MKNNQLIILYFSPWTWREHCGKIVWSKCWWPQVGFGVCLWKNKNSIGKVVTSVFFLFSLWFKEVILVRRLKYSIFYILKRLGNIILPCVLLFFNIGPAQVAQWWVCRTHDLLVVSLIPGRGDFSFRRIFTSHLCRSMWESSQWLWKEKVLVWESQETHVRHWPSWYDLSC